MGRAGVLFRRWRDRLREEGPEGLRDRRIGKPSSRRAAAAEILRMHSSAEYGGKPRLRPVAHNVRAPR